MHRWDAHGRGRSGGLARKSVARPRDTRLHARDVAAFARRRWRARDSLACTRLGLVLADAARMSRESHSSTAVNVVATAQRSVTPRGSGRLGQPMRPHALVASVALAFAFACGDDET